MDHPAINFRQLLREEKERARQKRREATTATTTEDPTKKQSKEVASQTSLQPVARVPSWTHPLFQEDSFPRLDRQKHCVCQKPPCVFYVDGFVSSDEDRTGIISWLQQLDDNVKNTSNDEQDALGRWTTLPHAGRRVALFDARGNVDDAAADTEALVFPEPLDSLARALVEAGVFDANTPPNHILVNEYANGSQGIMAHTDGPAYYHRTATISLSLNEAAGVLLDFTPSRGGRIDVTTTETGQALADPTSSEPCRSPYLEELVIGMPQFVQVLLRGTGSLVVFEDLAYLHFLHSIEPVQDGDTFVYAAASCVNAAPTTPVPTDYRISLTFRHKYSTTTVAAR
jgi:hypothetical protein